MVQGYKVVTWSIHGLTYGLVSREGNQTQQSCMVLSFRNEGPRSQSRAGPIEEILFSRSGNNSAA
jgi:hypothetical protein